MSERDRIEEHIAHLTRVVDELNEVVTGQSKQIDRLEARVRRLMEREAERDASATAGVILGDERPPHY
jgi:SlyX protein